MKKQYIAAAALAALASWGTVAQAAQGDILVRARALAVIPDTSTSSNSTLSAVNVGVNSSYVPELDFTYMFTDHIGAEVILGTTRNALSSSLGGLGRVSLLPPTITLQYHFNDAGTFRPYVGAGINYTRFYDNSLHVGDAPVHISQNSFGPALQVGVDYKLSDNWFFNVDVKKLWVHTKASVDGLGGLGTLHIDPWIVGVGVGRRF